MEKPIKRNFVARMLDVVERVGNKLPHPGALFAYFAVGVVILSGIISLFDISAVHPQTGEVVNVVNLLSREGLHSIMTNMVDNFTGFAPLGTVLVALLGIGIAETSGLMSTGLRLMVLSAPKKLLTFTIVFAGILSNAASEVGYVVLVPLGGLIFLAVGRHPLAGMAAAFAGVSGGYSANLLLGTIDPLLAGISEEAARIVEPDYTVNPAANYYFMFVSTFFIAALGTWITEKVVIPKLGKYEGDAEPEKLGKLTASEKRGLKFTLFTLIVVVFLLVWSAMPIDAGFWAKMPFSGFLRNPETGGLLKSPFMDGIVATIFLVAGILGIAYGIGAKTLKTSADVINGMGKSMSTMGTYIVLVFFAAQFVAYFVETNLGIIFAIKGANFIQSIGMGRIPLMIVLVLMAAAINIILGSASAKWAIMAPVFIPMFMLLGYSPEFTQLAYRVGDSTTNIISPMMSYFALIVAFFEKYDKNAGIGTIIATMLPYTIVFLVAWLLLLIAWISLDIPIGPGAPLFYAP